MSEELVCDLLRFSPFKDGSFMIFWNTGVRNARVFPVPVFA
jgi:hypothetical protein